MEANYTRRSYTVVFLFHKRWERAVLFGKKEAEEYVANVQRWPGVEKLYVVVK